MARSFLDRKADELEAAIVRLLNGTGTRAAAAVLTALVVREFGAHVYRASTVAGAIDDYLATLAALRSDRAEVEGQLSLLEEVDA